MRKRGVPRVTRRPVFSRSPIPLFLSRVSRFNCVSVCTEYDDIFRPSWAKAKLEHTLNHGTMPIGWFCEFGILGQTLDPNISFVQVCTEYGVHTPYLVHNWNRGGFSDAATLCHADPKDPGAHLRIMMMIMLSICSVHLSFHLPMGVPNTEYRIFTPYMVLCTLMTAAPRGVSQGV